MNRIIVEREADKGRKTKLRMANDEEKDDLRYCDWKEMKMKEKLQMIREE